MDMILEEYKTELTHIKHEAGHYDRNTGKFVQGGEVITPFVGAILPLNTNEIVRNPEGAYSRDDRKLYTSLIFEKGETIVWGDKSYTIQESKTYEVIDEEYKKYYLKRVGVASE